MLNKGKIVNFGGTEEVLEVQGEAPKAHSGLTCRSCMDPRGETG